MSERVPDSNRGKPEMDMFRLTLERKKNAAKQDANFIPYFYNGAPMNTPVFPAPPSAPQPPCNPQLSYPAQ